MSDRLISCGTVVVLKIMLCGLFLLQIIDEFVAVEELHALGPKQMSSLLLEEESLILKLCSAKGVTFTVSSLPRSS